jgi:hypothetical protein
MLNRITLAVALVAAATTVSLASESDPNLFNRYPAAASLQSAPVSLNQTAGHAPQVLKVRYDSAPLISGGGY